MACKPFARRYHGIYTHLLNKPGKRTFVAVVQLQDAGRLLPAGVSRSPCWGRGCRLFRD